MGQSIHLYTIDLDDLFSIIGSADRDALRDIGVQPGEEFHAASDDAEMEEEEDYLEDSEEEEDDEEDEEDEAESLDDWDYEAEEEISAKEVLTKMIVAGVPPDLAENEVEAILNYMANRAINTENAQPIDVDDVIDAADADPDSEWADSIRALLLEGIDEEEMAHFIEWLLASGASHDLILRMQMLCYGRLPESEEPAFIENEESALARSGYLTQNEIAQISDDLADVAEEALDDFGYLPKVLAAVLHYCNIQSKDLFAVVAE